MRIATLFSLSLVGVIGVTTGAQARPQNVPTCSSVSYMVLPDGHCLNLTYTTILAQSRSSASAAQKDYQDVLEANAVLDTSLAYQLRETEKQRKQREETQMFYAKNNRKESAKNQEIEDIAWPIHVQAMGTVQKAFSH